MIVDADRAPHPQRVGVLTKAGALNVQDPKEKTGTFKGGLTHIVIALRELVSVAPCSRGLHRRRS